MSVDRCARCGDLVDTDDEPEAYVEVGNMRAQTETLCLCRNCRERHEEELESQQEQRELSESQQAIIDKINAENDPRNTDWPE